MKLNRRMFLITASCLPLKKYIPEISPKVIPAGTVIPLGNCLPKPVYHPAFIDKTDFADFEQRIVGYYAGKGSYTAFTFREPETEPEDIFKW